MQYNFLEDLSSESIRKSIRLVVFKQIILASPDI